MAYTSKGKKPINAKVLDGGASWKDRYQVDDETASIIKICATFIQDGNEACLIITNLASIDFGDYFGGTKEKFPIGSMAIVVDNGTLQLFVKTSSTGWNAIGLLQFNL